jgi:hypothetical protein
MIFITFMKAKLLVLICHEDRDRQRDRKWNLQIKLKVLPYKKNTEIFPIWERNRQGLKKGCPLYESKINTMSYSHKLVNIVEEDNILTIVQITTNT